MIESASERLRQKGYEIEEDLCRKYNSVYELPAAQKWWFSFCIGRQILKNEKNREFGYEKNGYCRFAMEDKLLFDDMNLSLIHISLIDAGRGDATVVKSKVSGESTNRLNAKSYKTPRIF